MAPRWLKGGDHEGLSGRVRMAAKGFAAGDARSAAGEVRSGSTDRRAVEVGMLRDAHGLPLTAPSSAAASAFDEVVTGYLSYRADTPKRLERLMSIAPEMPMAQTLKGYLMLLAFKRALLPVAAEALAAAERAGGGVTAREAKHRGALAAWVAGDVGRTLAIWEEIMSEQPRDVLAFRLHHFTAFWRGEVQRMAAAVDRVLPAFAPDELVQAQLLACKAFAYEECGRLEEAELAGREAIRRNPGDLWAAHAVAHILEMRGQHNEGIALMTELEPHWEGGNSLLHHLWWHRGLYHYERGEYATVLDLYDRHFRNPASPIVQATPDLYIDVQNAISMLFRLERLGVDVGGRWDELADKAEARIGDHLSTFTLPHWMMALAATRRFEAAGRMIEAMRQAAADPLDRLAPVVRDHALPVCEAIVARAKGEPGRALALMRPALNGMEALGGSHAQQDVLQQLFLDCALAAGSTADTHRVIQHVAKLYAASSEARRGYAMAGR
jgi:tetratricopeptide (TPR) repeat protein